MKIPKKILFLSIVALISLSNSYCQIYNEKDIVNIKNDADSLFDFNYYKEAITLYKKIEDILPDVKRKIALSYYYSNDYRNSLRYYENMFFISKNADDFYKYINLLINFEEYEKALKLIQENDDGSQELDILKQKCIWSINNKNTAPKTYNLNRLNLDIGNKGLGIVRYKKGFLYSAPQKYGFDTSTVFYNIKYAYINDKEELIVNKFNKKVDRKYYEGFPSLTEDELTVYFTSNSVEKDVMRYSLFKKKKYPVSEKGDNILKLYQIDRIKTKEANYNETENISKEKWTEPKELNFCNNNFNYTHPFINKEGATIYFASDMPGGYGGYDIYYSNKVGENWTEPINLGSKVNTIKDELTPFLLEDTLFFSSYGQGNSFGGCDIYKSTYKNDKWDNIVNIGKPFNSSKDDFAFSTSKDTKEGFLISNRDDILKNYDIIYKFNYYYQEPPPKIIKEEPKKEIVKEIIKLDTINAIAKLELTYEPLPEILVELIDVSNNKKVKSDFTNFNGTVQLILDQNIDYKVNFLSEGYTVNFFSFDIPKKNRQDVIALFNKEKFVLRNIYFDYGKATLWPESEAVLDNVYNYLVKYNKLKIEISAHTDCRSSYHFNMNLSQRRAESIVNYLVSKGIPQNQIVAKGYGESVPVNRCECEGSFSVPCTEEEHQANRRVEIKY